MDDQALVEGSAVFRDEDDPAGEKPVAEVAPERHGPLAQGPRGPLFSPPPSGFLGQEQALLGYMLSSCKSQPWLPGTDQHSSTRAAPPAAQNPTRAMHFCHRSHKDAPTTSRYKSRWVVSPSLANSCTLPTAPQPTSLASKANILFFDMWCVSGSGKGAGFTFFYLALSLPQVNISFRAYLS